MDYTFQHFEETDRQKKEVLRMMIGDVIGAEMELQANIKELLKD